MKNIILFALIIFSMNIQAQQQSAQLTPLPFGSIKPEGWLKAQMQADLEGFVGNLDSIVPDLMYDPIYGEGRIHKNTGVKELGNNKEGDAAGDEQYKWWNSETQSNWWDGYIRNVLMLGDTSGFERVNQYVTRMLATQDSDGYIGIYDKELRYHFESENGELWAKATLYRGLLAYYEYTGDEKVFVAVQRAVENVMENYPINASSPFNTGNAFNGGVSHGLMFTDILERLYYLTQNQIYRDYAVFLYLDFCNTYQSEADAQLKNIQNPDYKLKSHGVHTYEHIRPLIIAAYSGVNSELSNALPVYMQRIANATTISGGAIGDEWIAERNADATHTGYEYCSLQELLDSYCFLLQKTGKAELGDIIEDIFFNAAQGSRHPEHSCIAYLKTDNSFEMSGTKNGLPEPDRKQTRYKYSPAHQDVAVCCSPNAGRISPYFIQNAWMKENDSTLVAVLLVANKIKTTLSDNTIEIENKTDYPYADAFTFSITQSKQAQYTLKFRIPAWVTHIHTQENYTISNGYMVITRVFNTVDVIRFSFETEIQVHQDATGGHYFTRGALLYAAPIPSVEIQGKTYWKNFTDYMYMPVSASRYTYQTDNLMTYSKGTITTTLINSTTGKPETVGLIPIGKTILRQVTF